MRSGGEQVCTCEGRCQKRREDLPELEFQAVVSAGNQSLALCKMTLTPLVITLPEKYTWGLESGKKTILVVDRE